MTAGSFIALLLPCAGVVLLHVLPSLRAEVHPAASTLPMTAHENSVDGTVLALRLPASELVYFARSRFTMGSTSKERETAIIDCTAEPLAQCSHEDFFDEGPRRNVTLSAYWLARYEVRVEDYERCVAAGRCQPVPYYRGAQRFRRAEFPVSLVTWHDARNYCAFWGGRLPTEAEFERAARGLSGRVYPWGNLYNARISNHGQIASDPTSDVDGYAELAPVGAFPDGRTKEGVFDLAGNVSEWMWDRYATQYDSRDTVDPQGPIESNASLRRVVRGGDYESARPQLRGAARHAELPETRRPTLGFRCARSAGVVQGVN